MAGSLRRADDPRRAWQLTWTLPGEPAIIHPPRRRDLPRVPGTHEIFLGERRSIYALIPRHRIAMHYETFELRIQPGQRDAGAAVVTRSKIR